MACPHEPEYFNFIRFVWPSITERQFRNQRKQYSHLLDEVKGGAASIKKSLDAPALRDNHDLVHVEEALRQSGIAPRDHASETLDDAPPTPLDTEGSRVRTLRRAISLWLTMGFVPEADKSVKWRSQTLESEITTQFEPHIGLAQPWHNQQHLHNVTATSLCSDYGYSIRWTHDLREHLLIDRQAKNLTVYEDKIAVYNHLQEETASLPVPNGLFEETIDTLNLLFPFLDESTKKMLDDHGIAFHGLGLCNRPRRLLLSDYIYWRDQVLEIYEILQTPPTGTRQLRPDREGKNLLLSLSFWVAAGAGIVAVLGMGLSVVSLVYSIRQYNMGLEQNKVSIIQACGDSYVRDQLPQLCSSYGNRAEE